MMQFTPISFKKVGSSDYPGSKSPRQRKCWPGTWRGSFSCISKKEP